MLDVDARADRLRDRQAVGGEPLEAWGRWPARSFDGQEETAIGLGEPALQSLGATGYERLRDARRALDRAGERIVAVDPSYELVRCCKRSGWTLVVRRLSGSKTRAAARQGASWRSEGIPSKSARATRVAVRAEIRGSLGSAGRKRRVLKAFSGLRSGPATDRSSVKPTTTALVDRR